MNPLTRYLAQMNPAPRPRERRSWSALVVVAVICLLIILTAWIEGA